MSKSFECDVCIVTNLAFPGGNTSSTLDEVKFLNKNNIKVLLVHQPLAESVISSRYDPWSDIIVKNAKTIKEIICKTLIVRHPRVICHPEFINLGKHIKSERICLIINNSVIRPNGKAVYDMKQLLKVAMAMGNVQIYPISSLIRAEFHDHRLLSSVDWFPTFDLDDYINSPKGELKSPFRIGRHSRDGIEKWLENPILLKQAYPNDPDFEITILGGADNVTKILGKLPSNWKVIPFGKLSPKDYLRSLDVFVYFPNSHLVEAFGRTVVEAMIAGVPCILPTRFRITFGNLAFYCEPKDVKNIILRLSENNTKRMALLKFIQNIAISLYSSSSLTDRFPELNIISVKRNMGNITNDLIKYRHFVENG